MQRVTTFAVIAVMVLFAISGCDLLDRTSEQPTQEKPMEANPNLPNISDADRFRILEGPYFPFAELENVVRDEMGAGYQIADWEDLLAQSNQLDPFLDAIGLERGSRAFVFLHGKAHPDTVSAGVRAQHPGPAAFRFLAYRGPASELDVHFENLVIIDDSLDPDLVLFQSWNEPGDILVVTQ